MKRLHRWLARLGINPPLAGKVPHAADKEGAMEDPREPITPVEPVEPVAPVRILLPTAPGRMGVNLLDFYQDKRAIQKLIVHHSAGPSTATVASVRAFHTSPPPAGRGWSDIAYHLVLRLDGDRWSVEPGRPVRLAGAHDQGQNADSIGICVFGDWTRGPVPASAWELLVEVVGGLLVLYGLTVEDVEGHRENEPASTPTSCPGFAPADLRRDVAAYLAPLARQTLES